MVRGLGMAVTWVLPGVSQCAETTKMAFGLGIPPDLMPCSGIGVVSQNVGGRTVSDKYRRHRVPRFVQTGETLGESLKVARTHE